MKLPSRTVIEIDGFKFMVRPQHYTDFARAMEMAGDVEDERFHTSVTGAYSVMLRIESWEGIEKTILDDEGNHIVVKEDCSMENKEIFFGQNPGIFNQIPLKLAELEGAEEKNSETSQAGSEGRKKSKKPAKSA